VSSSGFACLVLSSPRNANRNGWSAEACDGPVGGRNGEGKWTPFGGRQRLVKSLMLGPVFLPRSASCALPGCAVEWLRGTLSVWSQERKVGACFGKLAGESGMSILDVLLDPTKATPSLEGRGIFEGSLSGDQGALNGI